MFSCGICQLLVVQGIFFLLFIYSMLMLSCISVVYCVIDLMPCIWSHFSILSEWFLYQELYQFCLADVFNTRLRALGTANEYLVRCIYCGIYTGVCVVELYEFIGFSFRSVSTIFLMILKIIFLIYQNCASAQ